MEMIIHTLNVKSIHSSKGIKAYKALAYMWKTSTTRHLLKAFLTVVKLKAQARSDQPGLQYSLDGDAQAPKHDQGQLSTACDSP